MTRLGNSHLEKEAINLFKSLLVFMGEKAHPFPNTLAVDIIMRGSSLYS